MVLLPYIIFCLIYWIYKSTKEDGDFIERVSRAFSNSSVIEKILFGAGIGIFGFFVGIYFIFLMLKGVIQFFVEIPEQRQIRKENRLREIEKNERWWEKYNDYLKSYKDMLSAIKESTVTESKFGIINKQLKGEK